MADIRTANELRQDLEVENLDGAVAGRKANDRFTAAQAAYHSAMDVFLKHAKRAGRMSSSNTSAKDSD